MATDSRVVLLLWSSLARRVVGENEEEAADMTEIEDTIGTVGMTETEDMAVTEVMTGTVVIEIEATEEDEEMVVVVAEEVEVEVEVAHPDLVLLATQTTVSLSKISLQVPAGRT
jgi:hypothetical protein